MFSTLGVREYVVIGGGILALAFAVWEVVNGGLLILAGVGVGLAMVLAGLAYAAKYPRQ